MIIPATITKILTNDRLRIEFMPDPSGDTLVEIVPRPLDMHPITHVGCSVQVDYTSERGVERLLYTRAPQTAAKGEMIVPREQGPALPHRDRVLAFLRDQSSKSRLTCALFGTDGTPGVLWGVQGPAGFHPRNFVGFVNVPLSTLHIISASAGYEDDGSPWPEGHWMRVSIVADGCGCGVWIRARDLFGDTASVLSPATMQRLAEHVLEVLTSERARLAAEQRKSAAPCKHESLRDEVRRAEAVWIDDTSHCRAPGHLRYTLVKTIDSQLNALLGGVLDVEGLAIAVSEIQNAIADADERGSIVAPFHSALKLLDTLRSILRRHTEATAEVATPSPASKPDAMRLLDEMQALFTQHRREYAAFVHGLALLLSCEPDPDTIAAEVRQLVRPRPAKDVSL